MPQISRSCGWPWDLLGLCVRNYLCLGLNIILQGYILYLLNSEELVFNKLAGRMYMCNMGANLGNCPDGPGCTGPAGTRYTPSRLYNFGTWSTRVFVRDSLTMMFPDKKDVIMDRIDPGEFGMEDSTCRLVCTFLFVITLMGELDGVLNMLKVLVFAPTKAESWVYYESPDWGDKSYAKAVYSWGELNLVKIEIAGMPLGWKIVNFFGVFAPKLILWFMTLLAGFTFLMETSGIDSIIVNSTALGFILSIDELLFSSLSTPTGLHMMERLEAMPLYDLSMEEELEDELVLARHEDMKARGSPWSCVTSMIPGKLLLVIIIWLLALADYYHGNCEQSEDGTWVSKRLYVPTSITLSLCEAFFPSLCPQEHHADPVWVMPKGN